MAQQIIVTKDNYGIGLSCNFIDKNKNPIDLTDKVVEVVIVDANNETIDIKQAVIVDYTNAKASIVLEKIHTSTLGLYKTFWSVLDENQNITAQEDVYYYVKDKNNGSEGNVDSGFDVEDVFKNLENRLEESENRLEESENRLEESENRLEESEYSLKELKERTNYLNEQLEHIVQLLGENDSAIFITAFNGLHGSSLDLYISTDGVNLLPLHNRKLINECWVRDPSPIFHNGKFYIAFTNDDDGGFKIAETSDLINYTIRNIPINGCSLCWAPEWFKDDNGDIYIFLTLGDGTKENAVDGEEVYYTKQYYIKATDNTLTNFTSPTELIFDRVSNKIDSFVIKKDGVYYNFVKNEYLRKIEVYTSNNLLNWTYSYTMPFANLYVEGASISFLNGKYHFYADAFTRQMSIHATSTNLIDWEWNGETVKAQGLRTQHFTAISTNSDMNKIISDFYYKENMTNNNVVYYKSPKENRYTQPATNIGLTYQMDGNTLNVLDRENITYWIGNNTNIVINKINGICKSFNLSIMHPKGTTSTITLKNANNLKTPNGEDFIISSDNNDCERVIEVFYDGYNYRLKERGIKKEEVKITNKRFDTGTSGKITFKAHLNNGYISLKGLANSYSSQSNIIDSVIGAINNNCGIVNKTGFYQNLTVSYTASAYDYTITVSGFANYSVVDVYLNIGSYFIE